MNKWLPHAILNLIFAGCLGLITPVCATENNLPTDLGIVHEMRAERRRKMRLMLNPLQEKKINPRFGLLVIPVDFEDSRFADPFPREEISARIFGPEQENLMGYFQLASMGKLELQTVLAPVVHLKGVQADYSDIGWHGFSRTRALAREALLAVAETGYSFAALDNDGPDGVAASGDDDGYLDGVLILHAGTGQELDSQSGLIQALQYFLAKPVFAKGVGASFYAVAGVSSGIGIWAHETGHLLGMEDRYDFSLASTGESEVVSRGGLGRFSLMAAGAWGYGSGHGAALPDAFTLQEMGWVEVRDIVVPDNPTVVLSAPVDGGSVGRLVVPGTQGQEYFLFATRDPANAGPYDIGIPGHQLFVYHVDENLAEGVSAEDFIAGRHLRVSLVEADGNSALLNGIDGGSPADLFPGALAQQTLAASGNPGLSGYSTGTGVSLQAIASTNEGVEFSVSTTAPTALAFTFFVSQDLGSLELTAWSATRRIHELQCTVAVADTNRGSFGNGQKSIQLDLLPDDGEVFRPQTTIPWVPKLPIIEGTSTTFMFTFQADFSLTYDSQREWRWGNREQVLEFGESWPGLWTVNFPEGNAGTTWQRWEGPNQLLSNGQAVLACTGSEFMTPEAWPQVHYGNQGHTTLTSSALSASVSAVRIVHAIETENEPGDTAFDGGRLVWLGADGSVVPGEPFAGLKRHISDLSNNPLHGLEVFAEDTLSFRDEYLVWSVAVVPLPKTGVGPWQLRLEFASNSLWRRRGWFVADLEPLYEQEQSVPFVVIQSLDELGRQQISWQWPWPDFPSPEWVIQFLNPLTKTWFDAVTVLAGSETGLPVADFTHYLEDDFGHGRLRILGLSPFGWVGSQDFSLGKFSDKNLVGSLGLPWPSPGLAPLHVMAELGSDEQGWLRVYDLKGRRLRNILVPGGTQLMAWDGLDNDGRSVPAGLYFFRLEGIHDVTTRKVLLLR